MKFECNCTNEKEFREMIDAIHTEKAGYNFEISSRLWCAQNDKTIMVEHHVTTKECKDLLEDEHEPDWLTVYCVKDENDYDCSCEVDTVSIDTDISLTDLKKEMSDYAKEVLQKLALKEKASNKIEDLISKATDVAETVNNGKEKNIDVEIEK